MLRFFKRNALIIRKGGAVELPAEVKGLPLPTLTWLRDETPIEIKPEDERMTMDQEEVSVASAAAPEQGTSPRL